jgi:hypothetical protein
MMERRASLVVVHLFKDSSSVIVTDQRCYLSAGKVSCAVWCHPSLLLVTEAELAPSASTVPAPALTCSESQDRLLPHGITPLSCLQPHEKHKIRRSLPSLPAVFPTRCNMLTWRSVSQGIYSPAFPGCHKSPASFVPCRKPAWTSSSTE